MKNTNFKSVWQLKIKPSVGLIGLLLFFFLSPFIERLNAQNNTTLKGTVTDASNEPIIGANIFVKGSKLGTVTDIFGQFTILAPEEGVIKVSYIGYAAQEISYKGGESLKIQLADNSKSLDEVVVIGYGTSTKRDLTSAVSKLDVKSAQNTSVGSINEAMGGRIAGVQVNSLGGMPGEGVDIVIRGGNSITSSSSPLYVIDGFVMANDYINTLNPSDIESMEVLKDASATSIYGARGANGVLIITTKKGQIGKPTVDYRAFYGIQKTNAHIDVLSPYDFVKLQMTLSPTTATPNYLTTKGVTLDSYKSVPMVNYLDLLFRDAPIQNHSLSVSGGTQDTRYIFSGSYNQQDGVILGSSSNRYTAKLGVDQTFSRTVKGGVTVNYSKNQVLGVNPGSYSGNLLHSAWSYTPFVYSGQDPANVDNTTGLTDQRNNPILTALNEYSAKNSSLLIGNAHVDYEPIKGLVFKVTGAISNSVVGTEAFSNFKTKIGRIKGTASGGMSQTSVANWMNDYILNYNKTFDQKHKFSAMLGVTASGSTTSYYSFGAQNLTRDDLGLNALEEGTPTIATVNSSAWTLGSGLSRLTYGFDNRYLFSASFRADGSSRFSAKNRWGYFPSASAAWVLSEEGFMKSIQQVVSNTKIRASWGRTGNNNVGDFASVAAFSGSSSKPYTYYFGNNYNSATVQTAMANPNLKWETTAQSDLGLELGLFKQRVRIEADYFYKVTSDLLLNSDLPNSSGFNNSYLNIGKVQNQGFEFNLSTDNIRTKNFNWTSDFNISFIQNKVLELANAQPTMFPSSVQWGYIPDYNSWNNFSPYIVQVGKPLSQMYGWVSDGLLTAKDIANNYPTARGTAVTPGYMKFKDINGDGKIDQSDRTVIGNANPKHFGGFTNKFECYGFDLNIFMQWSYGNDIMNANSYLYTVASPFGYNASTAILDAFSASNPTGTIPVIGSQRSNNLAYYSSMVEDGSFLKLKSVQFGYTVPVSLLKKVAINKFRIYCSLENVHTWTHYSGFDPEVSSFNGPMTKGFDFSSYPRAMTFSMGGNLNF